MNATGNTSAVKTTNRQLVTNSSLILTTATKRKGQNSSEYSVEARMLEYEETNIDLLLKIDELQELSRKENRINLDLMKALQCKKHLTNLSPDCDPELFIDAAFSTAESIKIVASKLSPTSGQRLLEASFTPTQSKLKNFVIPRLGDLPPDSLRSEPSPSSVWHANNFPVQGATTHYTIGCEREMSAQPKKVRQGQC